MPRHVLSIAQFGAARMESLFALAFQLMKLVSRGIPLTVAQGRVMSLLFFEPSTRTSVSFAAAMQRLGGSTNTINPSASSAAKGETLEDTIRCLQSYSDVLVIRHPDVGAVARAAKAADAGNMEATVMFSSHFGSPHSPSPSAIAANGSNTPLSAPGLSSDSIRAPSPALSASSATSLPPLSALAPAPATSAAFYGSSTATAKGVPPELVAARPLPHGQCVVLNAGDGAGEHPTQALIDMFTILMEAPIPPSLPVGLELSLARLAGLHVILLGDLKFGRTTHSLTRALAVAAAAAAAAAGPNASAESGGAHGKGVGVRVTHVAPAALAMPTEVTEAAAADAAAAGAPAWAFQQEAASSTVEFASMLRTADVLYVTRVQKERFPSEEEYKAYVASTGASGSGSGSSGYCISQSFLRAAEAKPSLRVLHPLPRVDEIATDVDTDLTRAAYFRQMRYGLFVRMALVVEALGLGSAVAAAVAAAR